MTKNLFVTNLLKADYITNHCIACNLPLNKNNETNKCAFCNKFNLAPQGEKLAF